MVSSETRTTLRQQSEFQCFESDLKYQFRNLLIFKFIGKVEIGKVKWTQEHRNIKVRVTAFS